jgi:hypothetical protein
MNDAPIKQPDATITDTPAELQEPHFDEIAVLIAQPVEPIAQHEHDWFAWLGKPRTMVAILVVAALLGTMALALTLLLPRQPHVDSAATVDSTATVDSAATEMQADESPAEPASPLGAITEQLKATATPTKNRKARSANRKPVARRVGVIVYGSSSDRP